MNPYEKLANAIILRAVEDYRAAQSDLKYNPTYGPAVYTVSEVERFFRSGWFATLTTLDGEVLIERLRKEK